MSSMNEKTNNYKITCPGYECDCCDELLPFCLIAFLLYLVLLLLLGTFIFFYIYRKCKG